MKLGTPHSFNNSIPHHQAGSRATGHETLIYCLGASTEPTDRISSSIDFTDSTASSEPMTQGTLVALAAVSPGNLDHDCEVIQVQREAVPDFLESMIDLGRAPDGRVPDVVNFSDADDADRHQEAIRTMMDAGVVCVVAAGPSTHNPRTLALEAITVGSPVTSS